MLKVYTLTWQIGEVTHRAVGRGSTILYLYDKLVKEVDNDLLVIWAKFDTIITRNTLRQEMGQL
jgi:hypothetical protein